MHQTIEDLRRAYELSAWRGAVPFGVALAHPLISRALKLGAALITQPPRPDPKRLAAGDIDKEPA